MFWTSRPYRRGGTARTVLGMQITADRTACVGAGQCALVAGELFDQDDDGLVLLLEPHPDAADETAARRAVSLCPARAISVSE